MQTFGNEPRATPSQYKLQRRPVHQRRPGRRHHVERAVPLVRLVKLARGLRVQQLSPQPREPGRRRLARGDFSQRSKRFMATERAPETEHFIDVKEQHTPHPWECAGRTRRV